MADRIDFAIPRGIINKRGRPCQACGRPIVMWKPKETDRWMPLDVTSALPVEGNDFMLRLESHFARCTEPERFRRTRD